MVVTLRSAMLPDSPARRRFLETAAALPMAAASVVSLSSQAASSKPGSSQAPAPSAPPSAGAGPRRAVLISMLPAGPYAARFAAAKAAGFEAVEMQTLAD